MELQQFLDSVVAGERVRIAEVERIAARSLQPPIQIAADRAARHEADVFESIERRCSEPIALQKTDRLSLHLRKLSPLHKKRGTSGPRQKFGLRADSQPQLVGVELPVFARRIAPVFVLTVQLRVRGEDGAVICIEANLRDAQLSVAAGIDSLQESLRLTDRKKLRRKGKTERELGFLAVAKVCAQLEPRAEGPTISLCGERQGREEENYDCKTTHERLYQASGVRYQASAVGRQKGPEPEA